LALVAILATACGDVNNYFTAPSTKVDTLVVTPPASAYTLERRELWIVPGQSVSNSVSICVPDGAQIKVNVAFSDEGAVGRIGHWWGFGISPNYTRPSCNEGEAMLTAGMDLYGIYVQELSAFFILTFHTGEIRTIAFPVHVIPGGKG